MTEVCGNLSPMAPSYPQPLTINVYIFVERLFMLLKFIMNIAEHEYRETRSDLENHKPISTNNSHKYSYMYTIYTMWG